MVSAMRVPINQATCVRPMGPTDLLASGSIDPTIYSALAAPVRPVSKPAGRPNLLSLSGGCDSPIGSRAVLALARRHQLPAGARYLVGKGHRGQLRCLAVHKLEEPT